MKALGCKPGISLREGIARVYAEVLRDCTLEKK